MFSALLLSSLLSADPAAPNPVQREVALLHQAVLTALIGIETGNVEAVPAAFEKVEEAKAVTEKALGSGEWKPKAGAKLEAFKKQDQAFHAEVEKLVKAAAKKDVAATAKQLGPVLVGCPACHSKFKPERIRS